MRALGRSWPRTMLSASGVAVGIASVVMLIGAGTGAERALRRALEPLGHNLLVVNAARTETGALRGTSRVSTTLRVADREAIAREVRGVASTAPAVERSLQARAGGRTLAARMIGTTGEFQQVRHFPLIAGRFIDEDDLRNRRRVAVVGPLVVEELFRGESPLDEWLSLSGVPFRIVGVTREKGISADGADEDELVIIPLTTAMRRLLNVESLDRIYVQATSEDALAATRAEIATLLRRRHTTAAGAPEDFGIQDQTATVRAQQRTGAALSRVVLGLSCLLLVLGGVGLLVVLLLSVRERYSEIGVRIAVGGRPRDILLQFFTEAVLIAALGGGAGVAAGVAAILAGASLTRWPMALSWAAVVYPLAVSMAIALVSGVYPALRAARLDPILALNSQ